MAIASRSKLHRGLTLPAALLATALGFGVNAQTPAPPAVESNTIRAHFSCRSGKSIDATFVNAARSSVRLALSDGRKLSLPQARSASGARYANKDESFVFWNKGDTAFIEEARKTTYDGCAATKSEAR